MNRRCILMGAAVALVAPAPALSVTAMGGQAETEIMRLYRRYVLLNDAANVHPSLDDDELDHLFFHEMDAIEDQMMALSSTCPADFAVKMLVAHGFGDQSNLFEHAPVWIEARALVGGLVRASGWG